MCDQLKVYRNEMNQIDEELYTLYKRRLNVSRQIGAYKQERAFPILDAERERTIQTHLNACYNEDVDFLAYMYLHDAMMRVSRNAQYLYVDEQKKYQDHFDTTAYIGYQGIAGSFSSLAVKKVFKNQEYVEYETFADVFSAVEQGEVAYGVLPLENSIHGEVVQVFDLLRDTSVSIVGEIPQKIIHCLLALPGATFEDIREVYSHPQALAQSARYLQRHPHIAQKVFSNTAKSAQMVKQKQDKKCAAIASVEAAETYGLSVLADHIETYQDNQTRFIIIAKDRMVLEGANKTSILVTVDHQSGSLANVVAQFQYENINMVKITSRPLPNKKWQYQFFIDFEGDIYEKSVKRLLTRLEVETADFRLLGSYQIFK